jgi:low temperature requirement protein LtrA
MRTLHRPRLVPTVEPRRVHDWEDTRRATWLELFYDLVFVVAVARLAALLYLDHDVGGFLTFVALFVPIWWAWISFSYFADLFDEDRPLDRLAQLAAMFGAAVVAVSLSGGVGTDSTLFAGAFAAMFTLLALLYAHAGWTEPAARELARWYVVGSATGAMVWLASMVTPAPARYWLWGLAVVAHALLSGPIAYGRMSSPPRQVSHMPERFGLFALVVLGEAVLAVVNGIETASWEPSSVVTAVAGFVVAASIWWVYFGAFDEHAIDRAIASGRHAQIRSFLYGYGHLAVYAAMAAVGVAVQIAIERAPHDGRPVGLLAAALALVMTGMTFMAAGIGSQGPAYLVTSKAAVVLVGIAAVLVLDDVVLATAVTAAAWAAFAAVKTVAVRRLQLVEAAAHTESP